jgi:hypothetical protein
MTGAATSRCDYLATLGTLTFSPGETFKTISIPITDDAFVEGSENFNFTLTNSVGAALGSPFTSQITINDNDNTAGVNTSDNTDFFVRQHYIDFSIANLTRLVCLDQRNQRLWCKRTVRRSAH